VLDIKKGARRKEGYKVDERVSDVKEGRKVHKKGGGGVRRGISA
jgi:hypothetical protein